MLAFSWVVLFISAFGAGLILAQDATEASTEKPDAPVGWTPFQVFLPSEYYNQVINDETLYNDPEFQKKVFSGIVQQYKLYLDTLYARQSFLLKLADCACVSGKKCKGDLEAEHREKRHFFVPPPDLFEVRTIGYPDYEEALKAFEELQGEVTSALANGREMGGLIASSCPNSKACIEKEDQDILDIVLGRKDVDFNNVFWQNALTPDYKFPPIVPVDVFEPLRRQWFHLVNFVPQQESLVPIAVPIQEIPTNVPVQEEVTSLPNFLQQFQPFPQFPKPVFHHFPQPAFPQFPRPVYSHYQQPAYYTPTPAHQFRQPFFPQPQSPLYPQYHTPPYAPTLPSFPEFLSFTQFPPNQLEIIKNGTFSIGNTNGTLTVAAVGGDGKPTGTILTASYGDKEHGVGQIITQQFTSNTGNGFASFSSSSSSSGGPVQASVSATNLGMGRTKRSLKKPYKFVKKPYLKLNKPFLFKKKF